LKNPDQSGIKLALKVGGEIGKIATCSLKGLG
jgi:hypothetical protein